MTRHLTYPALALATLAIAGVGAFLLLGHRSDPGMTKSQAALGPRPAVVLRGTQDPASGTLLAERHRDVAVVDAGTGLPIDGCELRSSRTTVVVLALDEPATFRVDADADIVPLNIQHAMYEPLDVVVPMHGAGRFTVMLYPRATTTVRVRDRDTGKSVMGAQVGLVDSGRQVWGAATGDNGEVEIPAQRPVASSATSDLGSSYLVVRARGYLQWRLPLTRVRWEARAVDALLEPSLITRVTLVNEDGAPIDGGQITVVSPSSVDPAVRVLDVQSTNSDGECDVSTSTALRPHHGVVIWCAATGFCSRRTYLQAYAERAVVVLRTLQPGIVRLTDHRGRGVQGARVVLRAPAPPPVGLQLAHAEETTDAEGRASFPHVVADALYAMSVEIDDRRLLTLDVHSAALFDGVELSIPRFQVLSVHVTDRAGRPLANCRIVRADADSSARAVQFLNAGDESLSRTTLGRTNDQGRAELAITAEYGPTVLVVFADGYAPQGIRIPDGIDSLSVQLSEGVDLTVRAVDRAGRPVAGATLRLGPPKPVGERGIDTPSLVTQELTQYATTGPDGTATVVAYASPQDLWASLGQSSVGPTRVGDVEIAQGQVQLVLRPLRSVRVRLVDNQGAPIAGGRVAIQIDGVNASSNVPGVSDADGWVSVSAPLDGEPSEEVSCVAFGAAVGNLRLPSRALVDGAELRLGRVQFEPLRLEVAPASRHLSGTPIVVALKRTGQPVAAGLLNGDRVTTFGVPRDEDLQLRIGGHKGPAAVVSIGLKRDVTVEEPAQKSVSVRNETTRAAELLFVERASGRSWSAPPMAPHSTAEVQLVVVAGGFFVVDRQLPVSRVAPLDFDPSADSEILITERALGKR